jgi:GTPase Era involved in 16S rRNA processing
VETGTSITGRLLALDSLVEAVDGRIDAEPVAQAKAAAHQIRQRIHLSPDHVVTAVAGATGSGKSSLFNALIRFELSPVGVIRPTTLTGLACVWDPEHAAGAARLLDRVGVDERRRTLRGSLLDGNHRLAEPDLAPLVLIDLPDHDSAVRAHREETDRAVAAADLLVFVTDPQKYADASWHERYLRNLTRHQDSLAIVVNKIDTLSPEDAHACLADFARLLREAGLGDVPLIATSTLTGTGLAELRSLIASRIWRKQASLIRSGADLDRAAALISAELGPPAGPAVNEALSVQARDTVCRRLGEGTGAQALVDLIDATYRRRASAVAGWPIRHGVMTLARRSSEDGYRPWTAPVAAEPAAPPVQRPEVEAAVGDAVRAASRHLPPLWARRLRRVGDDCVDGLTETLDATLAGTEVGPRLIPRWWTTVQVAHWMLLTAALLGVSGILAMVLFGKTAASLNMPDTGAVPFPVLLTVLTLGIGAALDVACRLAAARAALSLRERVGIRMAERVRSAADQLLFIPMTAELDRFHQAQVHLRTVRSDQR